MPMPDFLIIGAAKCGTNACMDNLARHPQIQTGPDAQHWKTKREWTDFFCVDDMWQRGTNWYAAQFRNDRPCHICGRNSPKPIIGDSSTPTLVRHIAHERIATAAPDMKLIALLRNPVDRAYSHWNHGAHQPPTRHWPEWKVMNFADTISEDPGKLTAPHWRELIAQGEYATNLEHLFQYVPRERVYIGIAEWILADMQGEYAKIIRFLGADPLLIEPKCYGLALTAEEHWPYPGAMKPETRLLLQEYYRPHNQRLFDLLGYEITAWLT